MRIGRAARHAVILGSVLATALIANPALAGVQPDGRPHQPDGWVRYKLFKGQSGTYPDPSAWKGDNIYNTTGKYQKAKQFAAGSYDPDAHYVFEVTVQNDGPTDRFKVAATGQGDWMVKYFRGTNNITSAVVAGTYQTPFLATGATHVIKVKVWVGEPGTSVSRLVTLTSVGNAAKKDAVVVKATYTACGC